MLLSGAPGRPTLADVLPNCRAALDGREGTLGLPPARSAIVLLIDGLGASMLRARAGHARHLVRGWGKRHTAFSFPSTTVAGITSLTTGAPAGAHGLCAYEVYDEAAGVVRNQIAGWGAGMDPDTWQLRPTIFEAMRDEGEVRPVVVGMREYARSGLTRASLRGAEYLAADELGERFDLALDAAARGRSLVYLYAAELDRAGHAHGWESDAWLAALEAVDAAAGRLEDELPGDVGLVVTADHGMLDVPRERQIDLAATGPLLEGVVAVAGEPRLRHLHLAPGAGVAAARALAERWRDEEGSRAVALTRDEALDAGWYGPRDRVHPAAASRIGDVVVAATKRVAYYPEWSTGRERLVVGQHGSITPEETLVPLARKAAFAPA